MPEEEQEGILSHCHDTACGGHFTSQKIAMKVCIRAFIGRHYLRMPTPCASSVISAKDRERFPVGT